MGINDNIRYNSARRLRHIFRLQNHSHRSLLTVAATELITNCWNTLGPHTDLDKRESLAVPSAIDLIHKTRLVISEHLGRISVTLAAHRLHRRRGCRCRH